ncbi:UbiA prenyltransferase family-domain-containing protein [Boeremia exigua]|uniref:UbiA prenyltransferase family-domain-containing protein n=1 Tax=Boeremia exigua TaxID=749465 RepID=UPI001E8E9046|nr:UbiA prenyltransferase family-domain-containing protein [Boeremia exigua]KAH6642045.1 UbiA prenyltransferase family-domain-containing protein [Boeremia exigua]
MPYPPKLVSHGSKALLRYQNSLDEFGAIVCFYAQTFLLFTGDQIIDTVIPGTAFAVFAALSGATLNLPDQSALSVLVRIPQVSLWLWLVILQFCVQNQRGVSSVAEDSINKPWRPIPSGRMTSEQADKLLAIASLLAMTLSYSLNIMPIFIVYVFLITTYNDYGGGNKSGVIRNLFCGAGFSCYFGGALTIAIGPECRMSYDAWKWTAIVAAGILLTTIQTQEFRDEAGDKARGRRTLVTELGRKPALWTVFVTVAFWSVYVPLGFFTGGWLTALLPMLTGGTLLAIAFQAYGKGDDQLDRKMYKLWCLWMFGFCPLPFLADILA